MGDEWTCGATDQSCVPRVPEGWDEDECYATFYGTGDGCDCECGAPDPDCDTPSSTGQPQDIYGCADDEVCAQGRCTAPGVGPVPQKPLTTCGEVWTGDIVEGQYVPNQRTPNLKARRASETNSWKVYDGHNPDPLWEAFAYNAASVPAHCTPAEAEEVQTDADPATGTHLATRAPTEWFAFAETGCYDRTREVRTVEVDLRTATNHCGECGKRCNGRCADGICRPQILIGPPRNGG